jgi:NTP pyrophosphatase (non-canonical NTP hydrolase)
MKDDNTKISEVVKRVTDFRDERGWKKFHSPRNLATSIVLEASELLELFQWDLKPFSATDIKKDTERFEEIKKEMADVIIYSLSLANILNIDISDAIAKKLEHNTKKYPTKHFNDKAQDLQYYKKVKAKYRANKR